jgi:hypothetical protein
MLAIARALAMTRAAMRGLEARGITRGTMYGRWIGE